MHTEITSDIFLSYHSTGQRTLPPGEYNAGFVYLDASRVVPTGPQNVPPHVWQPLMIYLGRPA